MNDFKLVSYKRNKFRRSRNNLKQGHQSQSERGELHISCSSLDSVIKRIETCKEDIRNSIFYEKCIQTFNLTRRLKNIVDIVSYGLGNFSECVIARYQFAFLLLLKDHYKSKVLVYDPIFGSEEIEIANHFDCCVIDSNEEGKRQVIHTTLFFLPHCPKQLTNNLLWKNWNQNLSKCILIGNSFKHIIESNSDRFLRENLIFVHQASSFVKEFEIENCYKFQDIFNDLSLHIFLEEDVVSFVKDVLILKKEPVYQEDDLEFITRSIKSNLSISN